MSKYLKGAMDGTGPQVPIPAGANLKNPTIQIFDNLGVREFTSNYNMVDINRRITASILSAMA